MAATSEWAATPTNVTFGLAAATWLTLGASALQNGHHGVQNHSTAGLPVRLAPLNGAPDSVVPVNCRRSSATAEGGLTRPNANAAANTGSTNNLQSRQSPASIVYLLRSCCTVNDRRPPPCKHGDTRGTVHGSVLPRNQLRHELVDEVGDRALTCGPNHELGQPRRDV